MPAYQWIKCGSTWCELKTVNLEAVTTRGVYVIWHGSQSPSGLGLFSAPTTIPRVVRVGKGDIATRLKAHRGRGSDIAAYLLHTLYATWASVPEAQLDGVERFLADTYHPLVGERHPDVDPIPVTLPM